LKHISVQHVSPGWTLILVRELKRPVPTPVEARPVKEASTVPPVIRCSKLVPRDFVSLCISLSFGSFYSPFHDNYREARERFSARVGAQILPVSGGSSEFLAFQLDVGSCPDSDLLTVNLEFEARGNPDLTGPRQPAVTGSLARANTFTVSTVTHIYFTHIYFDVAFKHIAGFARIPGTSLAVGVSPSIIHSDGDVSWTDIHNPCVCFQGNIYGRTEK